MTSDTRARELAAAWDQIRQSLGEPIGDHLDEAREWVGDRAFLHLASVFDPAEVIIACGIQIAAELLDHPPVTPNSDRDAILDRLITEAHNAQPRTPPTETDKAIARDAFRQIDKRYRLT